ncbi:transcriptional regulator [Shewanella sp. OPT22]|nr:transcriptional regulator [Shewanella sp. OPT22]
MKPLNSKQIAELAGVSRSTVSRVINDYSDIPESTRKRVKDIIKQHNYTPNVSAQLMKGKAQAVITLYIYASEEDSESDYMCRVGSSYVMNFISSFIAEASKYKFRVMIELLKYDEPESEVLERITSHFQSKSTYAGVFLGLTSDVKFIDKLVKEDWPLAVIDREIEANKYVFNVFTKDHEGIYEITKDLIKAGNTSILYLGGDESKRSAVQRRMGYLEAMAEYKLVGLDLRGGFTEASGIKAVIDILEREILPQAIVCASDIIAFGVINELERIKPTLLDSIKVTGFDNNSLLSAHHHRLTSVKVDFNQMAKKTIHSLLDKSESPVAQSILVDVTVIKR